MENSHRTSDLESVILHTFKSEIKATLHQELLDDGMVDVMVKRMAHGMIVSLKAKIVGQRLDEILWKMPKDWKEAIKERFAPEWFKKRFPVRYAEFRVEPRVLYPQIKLPEQEHYIRYERIVEDRG